MDRSFGRGRGRLLCALRSKRDKFKTRHNLESFIKIQNKIWPVISPIVPFNPRSTARAFGFGDSTEVALVRESSFSEEWLSFHGVPVVEDFLIKIRRAAPFWGNWSALAREA
jgi:hypothetical protein